MLALVDGCRRRICGLLLNSALAILISWPALWGSAEGSLSVALSWLQAKHPELYVLGSLAAQWERPRTMTQLFGLDQKNEIGTTVRTQRAG